MRCSRILLLLAVISCWLGPAFIVHGGKPPTTIAVPPAPCHDVIPVERVQDWETPHEIPKVYVKSQEKAVHMCQADGCYMTRLNFIVYNGEECILKHELEHWFYGPLHEGQVASDFIKGDNAR